LRRLVPRAEISHGATDIPETFEILVIDKAASQTLALELELFRRGIHHAVKQLRPLERIDTRTRVVTKDGAVDDAIVL
jgi:hypothetical protein